MTKQIRLTDPTYKSLENWLRPRETFDDALSRILIVARTVAGLQGLLDTSQSAKHLAELDAERRKEAETP